ncbi:MAG: response regulator, partial [Muribaculaceae bacterium]|nr:response regulator [Muribaculaceae bacterium]
GDGILRIDKFAPYHAISPGQLSYITTRNTDLSGNSVYVMTPGRGGVVWIGSQGGLDYLSKSDRRIHKVLDAPSQLCYIHAIIEESDSVLWAATTGLGIYRVVIEREAKGIRVVSHDCFSLPGSASNYFFTIMRGVDGRIYAGNRGEGVFTVTENGLERFVTGTGEKGDLINNEVFSLEMTPDSALWIGTSKGVLRHNPDGSEVLYNAETGFPSSYIHSMYFDGENLWLSTNAGLIRFVPSNETFQVYGRQSGMEMVEFSDGAFSESDGSLFFGGNNGFVLASRNPEVQPEAQRYHPPLIFTRLLINGERRAFQRHIKRTSDQVPRLTLSHDDNNIGIGMTVPEYINSANLELFYRMNGDHDWIKADNYYATFNRLSPGSYELQARYHDTVTGYESPVSVMKLRVTPPWYLSWLMKLVYLAIIILLGAYAFRLLKRRERMKRLLQIEKIEREHHNQLYEQKLKFFTNITHEFCSPLTLIYGPCERLLTYEHSDNYICRYVNLIKQNAERLNSLIQEVIDFRRLETGHRERNVATIDVTALSSQILASFEHLAEQNSLTLEGEIGQGIMFDTDASAFTKIFYNLVSNAFKYTPEGGSVRVSVGIQGESLVLSVYNTGKGITPEDQKRIFNRYEVLDNLEINATKGLSARNGLGLAICHSMVHFLNGSIDIKSEPGEYAEFIVTLPPLQVTAPNPASPDIVIPDSESVQSIGERKPDAIGPAQDSSSKSRGRILVVDDDREMRMLLREGLDEYTVVTASSAEDAMTQMRDRLPDLVITDVMMPDSDGISLISEIKNNVITSSIPVIVLSAKRSNDDRVAGLRAGADAYVPKPFTFSYLLAVIERLLTPRGHVAAASPAHFDYDRSKLQHYDDMKLVDDVVKYIEQHLQDEKLTAATIADGLGIGLRKLYRRFQQLEQPSPSDLIREIRIAQALKLMLTTTLSMKEIITRCGYRNRGSFYKTFMKKYGMPPIAYREALTSRKIDEPDDSDEVEDSGTSDAVGDEVTD